MKSNKKSNKKALEYAALDAAQHFVFDTKWVELDKPYYRTSFGSICKLVPGQRYVVRDRDCESHDIRELMTYRFIARPSWEDDYDSSEVERHYLMFQDDKNMWWMTQPILSISDCSGHEIELTFEGSKIGKDWKVKQILKEEQSVTLETY